MTSQGGIFPDSFSFLFFFSTLAFHLRSLVLIDAGVQFQIMWEDEKRSCLRLCGNPLQLVPSQDGQEGGEEESLPSRTAGQTCALDLKIRDVNERRFFSHCI